MTIKKRDKKRIFEIPLFERHLWLCNRISSDKIKCLQVGNKGAFIHYEEKKQLNPDFIFRHLAGVEGGNCLIEAHSPEEAIRIFFNKWEGAKIGGEEGKARWINKKKPIIELPNCDLLNKHPKEGSYICGQYTGYSGGEFGMCILEGYDSFKDCTIGKFYEALYRRKEKEDLPVKKIEVKGEKYLIIKSKDI